MWATKLSVGLLEAHKEKEVAPITRVTVSITQEFVVISDLETSDLTASLNIGLLSSLDKAVFLLRTLITHTMFSEIKHLFLEHLSV